MTAQEVRELAAAGALARARALVIEFPEIWPALTRLANGSTPRRVGRPRKADVAVTPTLFAGAESPADVAPTRRPRRRKSRISRKGRKAISDAMKRRWKNAATATTTAGK